MNQEVENHIRNNTTWAKLPNNVRQLVGNSQKEYEKAIVSYSIKNQCRFKDSLVRYVRKDEKKYYEELLKYSKDNYMLYPYHLGDLFVRGLRITPFNYYLEMLADLMQSEKSYDTLPNFTAIDCLRLLGIGRNQYIDLINKYRSSSSSSSSLASSAAVSTVSSATSLLGGFGLIGGGGGGSGGGKRKHHPRTLLPTQPVQIVIEPWWVVNAGCVTDDDVKTLSTDEKNTIDAIIDNQDHTLAGTLQFACVHNLYKKGLIYLDVPLTESDRVELPPLEGFVMNRTTGDYFETLLYKLFVSIDERITLGELASLLQIDIDLVINAVAVYCRLAFAKKKNPNPTGVKYDPSWNDFLSTSTSTSTTTNTNNSGNGESTTTGAAACTTLVDSASLIDAVSTNSGGGSGKFERFKTLASVDSTMSSSISLGEVGTSKRIGFLFDSTLTAFLMMGNLSLGLKNHAVTMFEVGKLSDQMLDSFLAELDKVEEDKLSNEGEAQRYFEHAIILKSTIKFLRNNADLCVYSGAATSNNNANRNSLLTRELSTITSDVSEQQSPPPNEIADVEDDESWYEPMGVDLLRCESLASLDDESRQRVLAKNYSVVFSMAPYNSSGDALNSPPITADCPFHLGPALPEMNSPWFKFFLYDLIANGVPSLLLPKGHRLSSLPERFKYYDKFMIVTWGHDPIISSHSNLLITLNEVSCHGPILVQCYAESESQIVDIVNVAFNDKENPFYKHPAVIKLHELLKLEHYVGYISLINPYKDSYKDNRSDINEEPNLADYMFFDLRFGIPLFDRSLNKRILTMFKQNKLGRLSNLRKMLEANRALSLRLVDFIQAHQTINIMEDSFLSNNKAAASLLVAGGATSNNRYDSDEYLIRRFSTLSPLKKHSSPSSILIYPTQCVLFQNGKTRVYLCD